MDRVIIKIMEVMKAKNDLFINASLPVPETIDVFQGQPSSPEDFEFSVPAIFIDYSADYEGGLLYIYLHVLQDFFEDTESYAHDRKKGLDYFRLLSIVKQCLTGVKIPPIYGKLKLLKEVPIQTDLFNYHMITFSCMILSEDRQLFIDSDDIHAVVKTGQLKDSI